MLLAIYSLHVAGQIELYTHYDIVPRLVKCFERHDYRVLALYCLESNFLLDIGKFFGGLLNATAAMLNVGIPHLNVITKMDLIQKEDDEDDDYADEAHPLYSFFYPDPSTLLDKLNTFRPAYRKLNEALGRLLEDYGMVSFLPLNARKEESITDLLSHIDQAIQYGEQLEPKEPDHDGEHGQEESFDDE